MVKKEKIVCIVSIILVASIIITLFYITNNDINYSIVIIDGDIPIGSNITLAYEIKNDMFAPYVSHGWLDIWIYDLNDTDRDHPLLHYYIPIHDLNGDEIIKDQAVISAHYLNSGEYAVYTTLYYTTDMSYYKQLEIEFEIYREGWYNNRFIDNSFFCAMKGQYLTFYDGWVLLENLSYNKEWQHGQVYDIDKIYGNYVFSINHLNMSFNNWYWDGSFDFMEKGDGFYFYDDVGDWLFLKEMET